MKFRDNKIYQNKPNRDRKYLLPQETDSYRHRETSNLEEIRQKLSRIQKLPFITINKQKKSPQNQSLAERAQRYRRQIISERHSATQRSPNVSVISNHKRSSYQLSEQKAYHDLVQNKKRLRILTIQDKQKTIGTQNKRFHLRLNTIIEPLLTSKQPKRKQRETSPDPSNKRHLKNKLNSRDKQLVLNFTPKHKSLSKFSLQAFNFRKLKKKEFMKGYIRQEKLGKGGFSEVWSALQLKTGKRFAVKQMSTNNKYQTHLAQIAFSSYFFENGHPKPKFITHPGIDVLLLMNSYSIENQKAYVMYQKCDGALGEFLFQILEQTSRLESNKQKKYIIIHKALYEQMRKNTFFLKSLILQMAQALDLLQSCNIVHSDMKTSNILLKLNRQSGKFNFKLIDYGSSFFFAHLEQYRLATPQYMAPELLNYLNYRTGKSYDQVLLEYVKGYTNISAIDMWGLGCIILQILHGIPIWLHNQVKLQKEGKVNWKYGAFATINRSYNQILQKQLTLTQDLHHFVQTQNNSQISFDNTLFMILKGLLTINPANRIQPKQVIELLSSQDFQ